LHNPKIGMSYLIIFLFSINISQARDKYEKPTGSNSVENKSTSGSVPSLNKEISQFITAKIKTGQIQDASVYIRPLSSEEFVDIHPKSTYHTGVTDEGAYADDFSEDGRNKSGVIG